MIACDGAQSKGAAGTTAERAFHGAAGANRERLYCRDRTHLGPEGHELVAKTVLEAIEKGGR